MRRCRRTCEGGRVLHRKLKPNTDGSGHPHLIPLAVYGEGLGVRFTSQYTILYDDGFFTGKADTLNDHPFIVPKLNSVTLGWHTDWAALFGRERPLILEIGFGGGTFLKHLARTYPEHNVIGIEISNRCLLNAEDMLARLRLTNARVIYSMAETALHHCFAPHTIEQVHINFPDPWFRTRHSHRRLMQRDTLDAIVNRLTPDGKLFLATDIIEYAEMSAALLAETPALSNHLPTAWADQLDGRIVTKYESKARREGRACYYFAYSRNAIAAPIVPIITEQPMPHLVFSSPLTLDAIEAQFNLDEVRPAPDTYIHFMRVWRSRNMCLFELHIKEATIDQHMALTLSARADGHYTLQLSTLGHARPTEGVHQAVKALGDWLLALHPDSRVTKSKLREDDD
jgi:tRNA (guanine-N7-)-methyltransferase